MGDRGRTCCTVSIPLKGLRTPTEARFHSSSAQAEAAAQADHHGRARRERHARPCRMRIARAACHRSTRTWTSVPEVHPSPMNVIARCVGRGCELLRLDVTRRQTSPSVEPDVCPARDIAWPRDRTTCARLSTAGPRRRTAAPSRVRPRRPRRGAARDRGALPLRHARPRRCATRRKTSSSRGWTTPQQACASRAGRGLRERGAAHPARSSSASRRTSRGSRPSWSRRRHACSTWSCWRSPARPEPRGAPQALASRRSRIGRGSSHASSIVRTWALGRHARPRTSDLPLEGAALERLVVGFGAEPAVRDALLARPGLPAPVPA